MKFNYIVRTLSRTKRKDYENYVINAVWNRIDDSTLKPTSQWYVKNDTGWHLIDLYFPQINFGVECDEGHHKLNAEKDKERELTLIEVLSASNRYPYEPFHIDVTLGLYQVEQRIKECAKRINELVQQRSQSNEFAEWKIVDTNKYFNETQVIRSDDDITFASVVETVNSLMRLNMRAYQQGYFTPRGLNPKYKFWFPHLEIEGKAQAYGWHNILSEDGNTITEYNDDIEANMANWKRISQKEFLDHVRVTFAKVRDPITNKKAYKFVGLFNLQQINSENVRTYKKTSDSFDASAHKI